MPPLRRIGLYLEAIVFTVLVPGAVVFWLPDAIFDERTLALPAPWSIAQFLAFPSLCCSVATLRSSDRAPVRGAQPPAQVRARV